ncbi:hypothetical protein D9M69_621180 [compost metagenome]
MRAADAADRTFPEGVDRQPAFGGAVELQNMDAEALLEVSPDGLRHARGDDEAHDMIPVAGRRRLAIDSGGHAAQQGEGGAPVSTHDLP